MQYITRERWIQRITFAAESNVHYHTLCAIQMYRLTLLTYLLTYLLMRHAAAARRAETIRSDVDTHTQTHRRRATQYLRSLSGGEGNDDNCSYPLATVFHNTYHTAITNTVLM